MINVSNNYKQALTQPRTIDAKITYDSTTINIDDINSIKRSFNSTLFKTIAKQVIIDSNVSIDKDKTINPQFGLYLDNQFEYVSLGSYKTKNAPNLNKDTNSYEITAYDKIVESMVSYELTNSDITYPCTVRQLFVAIFTKLGWSTSGIPATFVNSTSQIEEDVYSNVNMTYRDVLDELCTISCMFLIDVNGTPTLKQKTTTSETINEDFMGDTNVQIKNQVFFNSLVFSRASESDNIYRKDDTSIANNGLHEFKVSDLQILSLNWRDNFIDAMWNYIKTFTYYAYEINTIGITYLEPIDTFTLSTFGSTYSTILLNSDLTIANGVNEKIYANEPLESETEYKYADTTDKRINQTYLIVDKQQGQINAVVSQVDEIEQELANPTSIKEGEYFDIEDALDSPLIDFSLYGDTQQDSTTGKNLLYLSNKTQTTHANGLTYKVENGIITITGTDTSSSAYALISYSSGETLNNLNSIFEKGKTFTLSRTKYAGDFYFQINYYKEGASSQSSLVSYNLGNDKATFTIPQDFDRTGNVFLGVYASATNVNIEFSLQLEEGSSKTSYEPYTNGASPNPDYPQPIHNVSGDNTIEICGKNIAKGSYVDSTTNNYAKVLFVEFAIKPNTTYTISFNGTNGNKIYSNENIFTTTSYITIDNNRTIVTLTTQSEIPTSQYTSGRGWGLFKNQSGNTNANVFDNLQIEKSSTATEYEAYTGQSQLISLGVENLFDIGTSNADYSDTPSYLTVANNSLSIVIQGSGGTRFYRLQNLVGNNTYTISWVASIGYSRVFVRLRKLDDSGWMTNNDASITGMSYNQYFGGWYANMNNGATGGTFSKTITIPNCLYWQIGLGWDSQTYQGTTQTLSNIILEKGSKANSYTPYGASYIELCKIGDYQDYIYKDNDRWILHKEIGKVVLDGSESWILDTTKTITQVFKKTDALIDKKTNNKNFLSNYFINQAGDTEKISFDINNLYIAVNKTTASTVIEFKTWLSTHNTSVYYVLAEPTDTEITDTTLLEQLNNLMTLPLYKNLTHITLTPNDLQPTMKIEYYRDTSLNNSYVPRSEMSNYYTKTETTAQIQLDSASIKQSVSELQTTVNNNSGSISTISNQVQTLQSSTSLQINAINQTIENGVEKVNNSLVTIDTNGIKTSKDGETFNTQITNKTFEVKDRDKTLLFAGYNTTTNRTEINAPELISERATIGVHRCETITRNSKKRTAWFYVGGDN